MTAPAMDTPAAIPVAEESLSSSELAMSVEKALFFAGLEAYASLGVVYAHLPPQSSETAVAPWFMSANEELHELVLCYGHEFGVVDSTVDYARRLLRAMPPAAPRPELTIEPDGQIVLEWQEAPRWVLTAGVGGDSKVYFSGLFGANRYRGAEYFDRHLPKGLAENLKRFLSARLKPEAVSSH